MTKKKAVAKKAAPKKPDYHESFVRRAIANGATVREMTVDEAADRMSESWMRGALGIPKYPGSDFGGSTAQPLPRIGSIVRWKDDDTRAIVVYRDENTNEADANKDDRYIWECYCLSDPSYREALWFTSNEFKGGEVVVIGHFDFFGLVNGNEKR